MGVDRGDGQIHPPDGYREGAWINVPLLVRRASIGRRMSCRSNRGRRSCAVARLLFGCSAHVCMLKQCLHPQRGRVRLLLGGGSSRGRSDGRHCRSCGPSKQWLAIPPAPAPPKGVHGGCSFTADGRSGGCVEGHRSMREVCSRNGQRTAHGASRGDVAPGTTACASTATQRLPRSLLKKSWTGDWSHDNDFKRTGPLA